MGNLKEFKRSLLRIREKAEEFYEDLIKKGIRLLNGANYFGHSIPKRNDHININVHCDDDTNKSKETKYHTLNCNNIDHPNEANKISNNGKLIQANHPLTFWTIIPMTSSSIYSNKEIVLEVIFGINGSIICRTYHRNIDQQNQYKVDRHNKQYTYYYKLDITLLSKESDNKRKISRIQCVFTQFKDYIYKTIQSLNTSQQSQQHKDINNYMRSIPSPQRLSEALERERKTLHEYFKEDVHCESGDEYHETDTEEGHSSDDSISCSHLDSLYVSDIDKYDTEEDEMDDIKEEQTTDDDDERDIFNVEESGSMPMLARYQRIQRSDIAANHMENNQRQKPFIGFNVQQHQMESAQMPLSSQKFQIEGILDQHHENLVDDKKSPQNLGISEQKMMENQANNELYVDNNNKADKKQDVNYVVNNNMNEADEQNNDENVDDVNAHILLEHRKIYVKILHHGKLNSFDDIYAADEDLIEVEGKSSQNKKNSNKKQDEDENKENKENHTIESDDDKQFEYDEQREGHIEEIDEKTYIFPREYKNIGPVFSYGKDWSEDIKPLYPHLKDEVLNNKYAPITEKTWNGILKKCHKILKGKFSSPRKNRWSKLLNNNRIGMKHLVALKLYTDFDLLQREFRKSFRAPYNKKKERLEAFYHWRKALGETFRKFSSVQSELSQPTTLFHGINSIMCLNEYKGTYYGPCSTTTCLRVARSFAGKNGMILVMKPELDPTKTAYKVLDISWISDYPDEREYLLFDHAIDIETWILSSDYDQYYYYYHNIFTKKMLIKGPMGHRSYQEQKKIPKYLTKLKLLIEEEEIKPNTKSRKKKKNQIKIKQNVNFGKLVKDFTTKEKVDLLVYIFQFALRYKYTQIKPSKFDQSLNANIQHVMKQIHTMTVPPDIVAAFMEQLRVEMQKELSAYFIRSVLNEYFVNTYVPLDASPDSNV